MKKIIVIQSKPPEWKKMRVAASTLGTGQQYSLERQIKYHINLLGCSECRISY